MASSTTSKITKAMAATILAFCQQTGQGVIVRQAGQEVGYTADDTTTVLASCTIPKATLDQIGYVPSTPSHKVFSVRYTSVNTMVKLAGELHAADAARTEYDNNPKCDSMSHKAWLTEFDMLKSNEDRATERLALAIEKSTPERVKAACQACGDIAYVFDGF